MTKAEQINWLMSHGVFIHADEKRGIYGVFMCHWKTTKGLQFRSEGATMEQMIDNLFNDVKETLFMRINSGMIFR